MQIVALKDPSILEEIRHLIWFGFGDYVLGDTNEHRNQTAKAQALINKYIPVKRIAQDLLPSRDFLVQSNLYLRAARPNIGGQESVPWHRESFYGCPREAKNVWMPILNCTPENSIRYVPGSEGIEDNDIALEGYTSDVSRFSNGNKIGLLYAPKTIIGGVDFSGARPMDVPEGSAVIFSSQLIHGAAQNNTDKTRFSIDFRIIHKSAMPTAKQHFASGQDYFVEC